MQDTRTNFDSRYTFDRVLIGGVFRCFGGDGYYMKTDKKTACLLNVCGPMSTAGEMHKFPPDEEVVTGGWSGLSSLQTSTFGF